MRIRLPAQVLNTFELLEKNNFSVYLVGGAVRDYILGFEPKDYDISTNASVDEMIELFKDYKIIETGLKHGTITIHNNHFEMEITSFRGDKDDLVADLKLRDYSMNSLAYNPTVGVIDVVNGINDINHKIIRVNDHNEDIIKIDPLRILRGIRMSYKYGFQIDEKSFSIIINNKELLSNISVERIHDEFNKILVCDNIEEALMIYKDVFSVFIPELIPMFNFNQNNPYHIYDVYTHTVNVVKHTEKNIINRLAALFHDIGKPSSYTVDDKGVGHFYGHPDSSSIIARKIMRRLKYSKQDIHDIIKVIKYHDYDINSTKKSVRKFLSKFGTELIDVLFDVKYADVHSQNPAYNSRLEKIEETRLLIDNVISSSECFSIKDINFSGKDILQMGIPEGRIINDILQDLLNEITQENLSNDFNVLLNYVNIKYKRYIE